MAQLGASMDALREIYRNSPQYQAKRAKRKPTTKPNMPAIAEPRARRGRHGRSVPATTIFSQTLGGD